MVPGYLILIRLGLAILLGGVIGYDRERHDHPAGLRTHILVALAAAMFMLISTQLVFFQRYEAADHVQTDPSRIASGVVMGLGFLGAGAILQTDAGSRGLTTAATLWLTTAIGLAAGCGMYLAATTATAASFLVLAALRRYEQTLECKVRRRVLVELDEGGPSRLTLLERLEGMGAKVHGVDYDCDFKSRTTKLQLDVRLKTESEVGRLLAALESLQGVGRVRIEQPTTSHPQ